MVDAQLTRVDPRVFRDVPAPVAVVVFLLKLVKCDLTTQVESFFFSFFCKEREKKNVSYLSHEKTIVSVEPFTCTRLMSIISSPDTFTNSSFSVRLHRLPSCVTRLVLPWFRKLTGRHTISTVERRAFVSSGLLCGTRRSRELPWGGSLALSSRGGCWPYRWQCLVRWSNICDWLWFRRSLQHCQILFLRHGGKSIFNLFINKRKANWYTCKTNER